MAIGTLFLGAPSATLEDSGYSAVCERIGIPVVKSPVCREAGNAEMDLASAPD